MSKMLFGNATTVVVQIFQNGQMIKWLQWCETLFNNPLLKKKEVTEKDDCGQFPDRQ